MAGKRQHIIPRFLQKGFASEIKNDKVFSWIYRKDIEPIEVSTKDIYLGKYFYGKDGPSSTDEIITDLEIKKFSPLCDSLRQRNGNVTEYSQEIAEFVANMSIRTIHLRNFFRESSERLTTEVGNYIFDYENIKRLLFSNPELTKKILSEALEETGIDQMFSKLFYPLMESILPIMLDSQKEIIKETFQVLFEQIKIKIPEAIKEGHNKFLAQNPIPEPRVEDYTNLNWFMCKSNTSIILGDIGCLFETNGKKKFKPITDQGEDIKNIFFPISTNQVLVGTTNSKQPEINTQSLNEEISKCSYEQFICSEYSQELIELIDLIGMDSGILSEEEMQTFIKDSIIDINNFVVDSKEDNE